MYMHVQAANNIECLAEGSMLVGLNGLNAGSQNQSPSQQEDSTQSSQSPQPSEFSPIESRPYDPIRDVYRDV
jgi:hypothetical protein